MALSTRQRAFAEHYAACGNGAEAARKAGYAASGARNQGDRLLANDDIWRAIQSLIDESQRRRIATAVERQAFWSETMRDDDCEMKDRLKASELLGRCQGDFVERIHAKTELRIVDDSDD